MVKLFSKNSNLCDHNSPTLQTDRQTTCDRNTALCTKVHLAVKTSMIGLPSSDMEYMRSRRSCKAVSVEQPGLYADWYILQESRAAASKPRDAASVLSVEVRQQHSLQVAYKSSQASKAAKLRSSKHAGAKRNLTQNQDSKSIKVTCLESVEKQWGKSNHNVGFSCQGFDFRRHSIYKKDLYIFPWISNIQRITVLYSASRLSRAQKKQSTVN